MKTRQRSDMEDSQNTYVFTSKVIDSKVKFLI